MAIPSINLTFQAESALVVKARAIHDRVLTIDTHVHIDIRQFTNTCNYTSRLTSQVTLPKMTAGGLDAVFLVVSPQAVPATIDGFAASYASAIPQFDAIHRLTDQIAPDKIGLARSPDEVRRIAKSGRKVAVIGVEGGAPIGSDLARVKEFYDRGARYMGLAHQVHTNLADSHVGEERQDFPNHGLSPLGRAVIAEMNRLGMLIDLSHLSRDATRQAVAASDAPVIASHTAARAVFDSSRNLDDELLTTIEQNSGVVQVVAFPDNLFQLPPEGDAAYRALYRWARTQPADPIVDAAQRTAAQARMSALGPEAPCPIEAVTAATESKDGGSAARDPVRRRLASDELRAEYDRRLAEIELKWPRLPMTVANFVTHIDYIVKKIGIDHVGIASDFNGGGGVAGWNDASDSVNVTVELVRRGYSENDIQKIWGDNLLRVWADVERVARRIQGRSQERGAGIKR
jgi:membrane dipeptidase